jgi:hypothetical protein
MNRKRRLSSAVGALVAAAIVGGVAYATIPGPGNVYSACMLKSIGTIRLIDKSLPATNLMSHCTDKETEISWNQAGQPGPAGPQGAKGEPGATGTNGTDGKNGVSVTTASEPAGANCPDGGVQLTAVNGVSYVCNGERGPQGEQGIQGPQGPAGVSGYEVVGTTLDVPPGGSASFTVSCPSGKTVLQGSWTPHVPGLSTTAEFFTFASSPVAGAYHVTVVHESGVNRFPIPVDVSVSCISA